MGGFGEYVHFGAEKEMIYYKQEMEKTEDGEMRKKIAVFATVWNSDYMYLFLRGLHQGAMERGTDLYVFTSFGDDDLEYPLYAKGENDIFFLPELSDFDGVMIAANNVGIEPWVDRLVQTAQQHDIPCVGIEQGSNFPIWVGADNYGAMYAMVEYLVREKNCRVLNYVGGPADHPENCTRKQAFLDVLKKYNIEPDPRRVRDYSFQIENGMQAYRDFRALGLASCDAVVCANDNMAIGYLKGAAEDGRSAPGDFLLTGFDNTRQAQQYSPQVTTVDRARQELGRRSLFLLDDLIAGKTVSGKIRVPYRLVRSESTGDDPAQGSDGTIRREMYDISVRRSALRLHLKHMRTALLGRRSLEDFQQIVSRFAPLMGMKKFTMGLESAMLEEGRGADWLFFGRLGENPVSRIEPRNGRLLPDAFCPEDGQTHCYLFCPCHCEGRQYGYWVIVDDFQIIQEGMLSDWMLALDNAVEALRQSLHLQTANRKLEELHRRDAMTGLYNRFALRELGEPLLQRHRECGQGTALIFADMDCLKKANDLYGHDVGDAALIAIADAIQQVCSCHMELAVRLGGDEFLMMGFDRGEEEMEQVCRELSAAIQMLGAERKLPFPLSASVGFVSIPPQSREPLEHHIRLADQKMYQQKMQRKNQN